MNSEDDVKLRDKIMELEELEKFLRDTVNFHTGIKSTDLMLKAITAFSPRNFDALGYISIMQHLVEDGEIIEIEYTVPQMEDRVKSLYFPKGTSFNIIKI